MQKKMEFQVRLFRTFAKENSCLTKKKNPCFEISEIIHKLPEYTDAEHRQKKKVKS